MGDFNMPPDDPSFRALGDTAAALITSGATTLSYTDGEYANLYDNIWAPLGLKATLTAGIFPLATHFEESNEVIRNSVSDHAPVYMILDDMDESSGLYTASYVPPAAPVAPTGPLVRGNVNSRIFHVPGCSYYEQMAGSPNLVGFDSVAEAEAEGYRQAQNCS
jgi:hypothetical protein